MSIFAINHHMETNKVQPLTLKHAVEAALKGRTQTYIIGEMNAKGHGLTDVVFSRKKNGHLKFTNSELLDLDNILGSNLLDTFGEFEGHESENLI